MRTTSPWNKKHRPFVVLLLALLVTAAFPGSASGQPACVQACEDARVAAIADADAEWLDFVAQSEAWRDAELRDCQAAAQADWNTCNAQGAACMVTASVALVYSLGACAGSTVGYQACVAGAFGAYNVALVSCLNARQICHGNVLAQRTRCRNTAHRDHQDRRDQADRIRQDEIDEAYRAYHRCLDRCG